MKAKLAIGILLLFVASSISCTSDPGEITSVRKLIIDTDAGIDDAYAIIMAVEAERFGDGPEVLAITCVNGNADLDFVALNVLKTLKVVNRLNIPVYKGAAHPLLLPDTKDHYFGSDGFGEFYYPDPPSTSLIRKEHAVNAMIALVKSNPGEVTLLALGPLTNVALAIRLYPSFLDELQQLIVMGGSTEGVGNVKPGIEFNFGADPAANFIVFNASTSKPTTLVPYETTRRAGLPIDFRQSLSSLNNTKIWLLGSAEAYNIRPNTEYVYYPDAVTAAVAVTSGSIVSNSTTYYSEAIYEGTHTAGMIVVDYRNRTKNAANTNLVLDINMEYYMQLLSKYISC